MAGTIVTDRIESDASYASSVNIASPLVIANTISMTNGTITGNLNIDNGTLFVNQINNRVGINTTTPNTALAVQASGVDGISILTDMGEASVSGRFLLLNSTDAGSVYYSNTLGWVFHTQASIGSTSGTQRFFITPQGYLRSPHQPSFSALKTDGDVNGSLGGTVILWNSVTHNTSSSYSNATGRFTAPVAGKYYFSAMGMLATASDGSNADIQLRLNKNGSGIAISNPPVESGNQQGMGFAVSAVVDMAQGDYVNIDFYSSAGSGSKFYANGGTFNNFSGFLIG